MFWFGFVWQPVAQTEEGISLHFSKFWMFPWLKHNKEKQATTCCSCKKAWVICNSVWSKCIKIPKYKHSYNRMCFIGQVSVIQRMCLGVCTTNVGCNKNWKTTDNEISIQSAPATTCFWRLLVYSSHGTTATPRGHC